MCVLYNCQSLLDVLLVPINLIQLGQFRRTLIVFAIGKCICSDRVCGA